MVKVQTDEYAYTLRDDIVGAGETSRVFAAHRDDESMADYNWAAKLVKDQSYNTYIEREYDILEKLKRSANGNLPLPSEFQIGRTADGRKALIMPLYRQSLLKAYQETQSSIKQGQLAIRAAKQYLSLLQEMADSQISCQDRKLGDLWWTGHNESGQLIVTDWNVTEGIVNPAFDMRRFGLLWYELLTGSQMLRDYRPQRGHYEKIQDKVSYGLWYVLGRVLGSKMGPQVSTMQELDDLLNELEKAYSLSPSLVINEALNQLKDAQTNLDGSSADKACILFDLAQRSGGKGQEENIRRATLWAENPLTQALPDLFKQLGSESYARLYGHLSALKQKVSHPQELGEIERIEVVITLLDKIKRHAQSGSSDLTERRELFGKLQQLLVGEVLYYLMDGSRDTGRVREGLLQLRKITDVPWNDKELISFNVLEHESEFWESFHLAQNNLQQTKAQEAIAAFDKANELRKLITYWPEKYKPTVEEIEKELKNVRHIQDLLVLQEQQQDQLEAQKFKIHRSEFLLDIEGEKWNEAVAETLFLLSEAPDNIEVNGLVQQLLEQLLKKRSELVPPVRQTLSLLEQRRRLVQVVFKMPEDLLARIPFNGTILSHAELKQELHDIQEFTEKIQESQRLFFEDPAQALQQALEGGYELFDNVGLSTAMIKGLEVDVEKLAEEATNFSVKREQLRKELLEVAQLKNEMSQIDEALNHLRNQRRGIEDDLVFYRTWQESSPEKTRAFFTNALELYLELAQARIEERGEGRDASDVLEKARHLLNIANKIGFLPDEYAARYEELRNELIVMQDEAAQVDGENFDLAIIEGQLTDFFRARKVGECYRILGKLSNNQFRKEWLTVVENADKLRQQIAKGKQKLPNLLPTKKRPFTFRGRFFARYHSEENKEHENTLIGILDWLLKTKNRNDPRVFELCKDDIQDLYDHTRAKLDQLNPKYKENSKIPPSFRQAEKLGVWSVYNDTTARE